MGYADLTRGPALPDTGDFRPEDSHGMVKGKHDRKREGMTDDELISYIKNQESTSLGYFSGSIAAERAIALEYYFGQPFGNEVEGRSEVISTDVADAIEGLLPGLLKPFISSDQILQFNPTGPHDEAKAEQESDYVNYIISQRNNGPLILYTWFKDALMQKNGFCKYYWEEEKLGDIERYKGLTDDDLTYITQDVMSGEVEVISARVYPDPNPEAAPAIMSGGMGPGQSMPPALGLGTAPTAQQGGLQNPLQPMPQSPNPGMPGQPPGQGVGSAPPGLPVQPMPGPPNAGMAGPPAAGMPTPPGMPSQPMPAPAPPPMLYDLTLRRTESKGKCTIENVPPEELLISVEAKTIDIKKARFVEHRRRQTLSEIRQMGFYIDDEVAADEGELLQSPEYMARRMQDEADMTKPEMDTANREVLFREVYIRIDYDGDGIAELRKVSLVGNEILRYDNGKGKPGETCNEEAEEIPFCVICPYIIPHKFYGQSVADKTMDIQLKKSTLERQYMDNLYTINNNRLAISSRVNLDDVLDEGIPGIVRVDSDQIGNDIMPLPVTPIGQVIEPMLVRLDNDKMVRVGYSPMAPEMDENILNKTATGVHAQQQSTQDRQELIARMFAETGVADLMRSIHGLLRRHATEPESVKLRGQWVQVDPRGWFKRMDMTVAIGLGTGNKAQTVQNMTLLSQMQVQDKQLIPGLVSAKNMYNARAKMTVAMGYKDATAYWTDPSSPEGQQEAANAPKPPPDPNLIKAMTDQQRQAHEVEQDKVDAQIKMKELQIKEKELANEQQKVQAEIQLAHREMTMKENGVVLDTHLRLGEHDQAKEAQKHQVEMDKHAQDGEDKKSDEGKQQIDQMKQIHEKSLGVFEKMSKVLSAPKKIIKDAQGEPIGLMPDLGD